MKKMKLMLLSILMFGSTVYTSDKVSDAAATDNHLNFNDVEKLTQCLMILDIQYMIENMHNGTSFLDLAKNEKAWAQTITDNLEVQQAMLKMSNYHVETDNLFRNGLSTPERLNDLARQSALSHGIILKYLHENQKSATEHK